MILVSTLVLLFLSAVPTTAQPVVDPTDLDMDGMPGVAPPPVNPQPAAPSILVGTGSILIDRSHAETFDVSGFMSFLETEGWTVDTNTVYPITVRILEPYDIVLIPTGTTYIVPSFSTAELAAFNSYLASGGGVWLFHDSYKNTTGINSLATSFGVAFQYDGVVDTSDNEGVSFWPTISDLIEHPVCAGVTSYGYYAGCCLSIIAPAQIVASADADAWSIACPSAPSVLAAYESVGRIVFSGDITPLYPGYYPERLREEEQLLLQNIANWLLGPPPNAVESDTWGGMKARFR